MPHYRLYFFDGADHIRHAVSMECHDDAEAIEFVESHRDGRAMELWERARMVTRIEAEGVRLNAG